MNVIDGSLPSALTAALVASWLGLDKAPLNVSAGCRPQWRR